MDRGGLLGELVDQEAIPAEAAITLPAVRIEDPERRPPSWRAVSVPGDQGFRALADHVTPETDPRSARQLEAKAGRFGHGTREGSAESGRLEHHEQGLRSTGKSSQATEPVRDRDGLARRGRPGLGDRTTLGEVENEEVHRTTGEQRAADGQAFVERLWRDDHQPFEPNAPSDGLHGIEAPGQVQPCDDRSGCLGFSGKSQDKGGPTAGAISPDGHARRAREAAGTQDCIECSEPGGDDPPIRLRPRRNLRNRCGVCRLR